MQFGLNWETILISDIFDMRHSGFLIFFNDESSCNGHYLIQYIIVTSISNSKRSLGKIKKFTLFFILKFYVAEKGDQGFFRLNHLWSA